MIKQLSIPYMGSKAKLAPKIFGHILEHNPNAKHFYDLFGGGAAMSLYAAQLDQLETVHYNELNTGVVELLKKVLTDGVTEDFYKWFSREEFHALKDDPTWLGGLVATCWSFGNNKEKGYLYSKENERLKSLAHKAIVNKDAKALAEFGLGQIEKELFALDDMDERRLFFKRSVEGQFQMQHIEGINRLQNLERLNRLQNIDQGKVLQSPTITNQSYVDVTINTPIDETVIYLDPPYAGTAKYKNDICHEALLEYCMKSPFKIYVSSYAFNGLHEVASFDHRSSLSATNNSKRTQEKLFCNQEEY